VFPNELAFAVYMLYALYEVNPRDNVRALRERAAQQASTSTDENTNTNTRNKDHKRRQTHKRNMNMEWLSLLPLSVRHDYGVSKFHRRTFRAPIRIGQAEFVMLQRVRDLAMEGMALCEVQHMEAGFGITSKNCSPRCNDGSFQCWRCSCANARDVLEIINRMQYNECFDLCLYSGPGTLEGFVGNDPGVFLKMKEVATVACFPCAASQHIDYGNEGNDDLNSILDQNDLTKSFQAYTQSLRSIRFPTSAKTSWGGNVPKKVALTEQKIAPIRSELSGYQWQRSLDRLQELIDTICHGEGNRNRRVSFRAEIAEQRETEIENFKRLNEGNGTDLDYSRRMLLKRRFRLGERRVITDVDGANGYHLSVTPDKAQNPYSTNEKDDDTRKEGDGDTDAIPLVCIGESISESEAEGIFSALENFGLEEEAVEEGGSGCISGKKIEDEQQSFVEVEVDSLTSSVPHAGADALHALISSVTAAPVKPPKRDFGDKRNDERFNKVVRNASNIASRKRTLDEMGAAALTAKERDEDLLSLSSSLPLEGVNALKRLISEVKDNEPKLLKKKMEKGRGRNTENMQIKDPKTNFGPFEGASRRTGSINTKETENMDNGTTASEDGSGSIRPTQLIGATALSDLLALVGKDPPDHATQSNCKRANKRLAKDFCVAAKWGLDSIAEEGESIHPSEYLNEDEEVASLLSVQMSGRFALMDLLSKVQTKSSSV